MMGAGRVCSWHMVETADFGAGGFFPAIPMIELVWASSVFHHPVSSPCPSSRASLVSC